MGCPTPEPVLITGINRGPSGTFTVGTVTSGGPTDPVVITNSGGPHAGVWDFQLPAIKGPDGDTGPRGPSGDLRPAMLLLGGM